METVDLSDVYEKDDVLSVEYLEPENIIIDDYSKGERLTLYDLMRAYESIVGGLNHVDIMALSDAPTQGRIDDMVRLKEICEEKLRESNLR